MFMKLCFVSSQGYAICVCFFTNVFALDFKCEGNVTMVDGPLGKELKQLKAETLKQLIKACQIIICTDKNWFPP